MTRVDFYILQEKAPGDRFRLACRVAEKAWTRGHRVFIHADSPDTAELVDNLLWTFRDGSFVPHGRLGRCDHHITPILIGHGTDAGEEDDVLINLSSEVPDFFSTFERVIEPVDHDEKVRKASRQRYRYYRDRGYPLNNRLVS
jgi:DNA polymerase-3 subunit chi